MKRRFVRKKSEPKTRNELSSIIREINALRDASLAELQEQHARVCGYPTRSNNRATLQKKLAWHVQANAEGGLSDGARARIAELAPSVPTQWQQPKAKRGAKLATQANTTAEHARRPELPPAGTVITREHNSEAHAITVWETDFEYRGKRYKTLSEIARLITGTKWDGFAFFKLKQRKATDSK